MHTDIVDSNDDDNGDDSARREYELVMQSFRGSYTRRAVARESGIACGSSGDGLDVSGGRDAGRSVDTDSADSGMTAKLMIIVGMSCMDACQDPSCLSSSILETGDKCLTGYGSSENTGSYIGSWWI